MLQRSVAALQMRIQSATMSHGPVSGERAILPDGKDHSLTPFGKKLSALCMVQTCGAGRILCQTDRDTRCTFGTHSLEHVIKC